jgi:asparagine synthase (glutamine-hydrolysing)
MSIIFGVLRPEGQWVDRQEMLSLAAATERYAPDGTSVHEAGRVGMGFQPLHTTPRSELDSQPATDPYGNLLIFDGRLDNHQDFARWLDFDDTLNSDCTLVLAAFSRWGEACFRRMVGDWALGLWSESNQTLYLARDHAGTRTLFFQRSNGVLRWSTYLDTLLAQTEQLAIDEEFAAAFLCSLPIRELTPYQGIRSVPPAHYVVIRNNGVARKPHWQWVPEGTIRHHSDSEYEEQFLTLFRQSVTRRVGRETDILAELSGGMDSSSIVCMADQIRRSDTASEELVDTISFYDDSEPTWDERPYFSVTEARRGKVGTHIATSFADVQFDPPSPSADQRIQVWPAFGNQLSKQERRVQQCLKGRNYRVILSGIGGDELLGGVPTPLPELADYLVSANFARLLERTVAWCVANRTEFFQQLFSTVLFTIRLYRPSLTGRLGTPLWVHSRLRRTCQKVQREDIATSNAFCVRPSALNRGRTWWDIMETLPHLIPGVLARPEYRFPYLDRDLVDFLLRVPPEQLVRPGRRRSLMRRALKDIVPAAVLERRRKGYLARGPLVALQNGRDAIKGLLEAPLAGEYGFIDPVELRRLLDPITAGKDMTHWPLLMKTIAFELWLRANAGRLEARTQHISSKSSRSCVSRRKRSAHVKTKVVST